MKKLVICSVLILLAMYFQACTRTVDCPPFDQDDLVLVPYSVDDTLRFVNQNSEMFEIVVDDIFASEAYTYKCKDLNNICICTNYVDVLLNDSNNNERYCFLRIEQNDNSDQQTFWYTIIDFSFEFDFINELPHIDLMDHMTYIGEMYVGGVLYEEVIEVNSSYAADVSVSKVYFNKENGILKFIEDSLEWELLSDE